MEVGPNIRQYSSQDQFIKQKNVLENAKPASLKNTDIKKESTQEITKKSLPAETKTEISKTAKDLAKGMDTESESLSAGTSVAKGVVDALGKLPKDAPVKPTEVNKLEKPKSDLRPIKKPAVFFIGGFNWMGLSGDNKKLEDMSRYIKDAKYFDYKDKENIISEIKRRPTGQPVILVGRGFGGDVAKEISNDLDSMENGFRKVDLLITVDSSSLANDIIPQNVVKHINLIDEVGFFNDGPNIARNSDRTTVTNRLMKEDILSSKDVQFDMFQNINAVLGDTELQNHLAAQSITDMAMNETLKELRS